MMRISTPRARAFARIFGLSVVMGASTCSLAQEVVHGEGPVAPAGYDRPHHGWGLFHSRRPPIPRTYSYYYDRWFNQPCHYRVVGPDGKTYWRTTVRGLPLGTPWPSHEVPVGP
jgi:hypothetical protein